MILQLLHILFNVVGTVLGLWLANILISLFRSIPTLIIDRNHHRTSKRKSVLLESLASGVLAEKQQEFVSSIRPLEERLTKANESLDEYRKKAESEKQFLGERAESKLAEKCLELETQEKRKFEIEKSKLLDSQNSADSVEFRSKEEDEKAAKIFGVFPKLDKFLDTIPESISKDEISMFDMRPVMLQALSNRLSEGNSDILKFAEKTFGLERTESEDQISEEIRNELMLLLRNPFQSRPLTDLCRLLSNIGEAHVLLRQALTDQIVNELVGSSEEDISMLFAGIRATNGDPRLLMKAAGISLAQTIDHCLPSDSPVILRSILQPFHGKVSQLVDLEIVADFCEKAGISGGELIDWSKVDSSALSVCRRLTKATEYSSMVKEVIRRNQVQEPTRLPRKSVGIF